MSNEFIENEININFSSYRNRFGFDDEDFSQMEDIVPFVLDQMEMADTCITALMESLHAGMSTIDDVAAIQKQLWPITEAVQGLIMNMPEEYEKEYTVIMKYKAIESETSRVVMVFNVLLKKIYKMIS